MVCGVKMNVLNIGIAGPITIGAYQKYLYQSTNINHTQPIGLGGTGVNNLVLELLRRGRRVTIFTLDRSVESEVILQGERLKICIGPYRSRHRARDLFAVERAYIQKAIEREMVDIVHAHWTYEFALGALQSKVPTLVTARDAPLNILQLDPTPYRAMRTLMAFQVARQAKYLTCVSSYVADHFTRWMRYRGFIATVPNCLSPEAMQVRIPRIEKSGEILTFACANQGWGRRKNVIVALHAFNEVRRTVPKSRLMLFGEDYGPGEIAIKVAKSEGLTENVMFIGHLPYSELQAQLASDVDVFVHPSLEESFGLVLMEAMALSIPVIAGERSRGTRFVLDEGKAGILACVRSHHDLAGAMLRCADIKVRRHYGEIGFHSVNERFCPKSIADTYEAIYQKVIGQA